MLKNSWFNHSMRPKDSVIKSIEQIKETIEFCWQLSRYELAQTISENLGWYTASGSLKVQMPVLNCWKSCKRKGFCSFLKSEGYQSPLKDPYP